MVDATRSEQTKQGQAAAAARGRKAGAPRKVTDEQVRAAMPLGATAAAKSLGITRFGFIKRRRKLEAEA